jgi:hypothetical protein
MSSDIDWSMLDFFAGDQLFRQEPSGLWNDRIGFRIDPIPNPNLLEIQFNTAPNITWWKSVQIRDANDAVLLCLETQDQNHGPRLQGIDVSMLEGARISFHKAKMFGVHTGMYQLPPDLTTRGGTRIVISWEED